MTFNTLWKLGLSISLTLICLFGCYDSLYPTASIVLQNNTDMIVSEVYIVGQTETDWGTNLLVGEIASGSEVTIESLQKKSLKVKVVFSNGFLKTIEDIDLLEVERYTLTISN